MVDAKELARSGWAEHAEDPRGVADRLVQVAASIPDEATLVALAGLGHHVFGEHLAAWAEGLAWLDGLAASPVATGGAPGVLARCRGSLRLASGAGDDRPSLGVSDRIRVGAMAAASLTPHDPARALPLFEASLAEAETSGLPASDPMNVALAVTGNNLACTLEEKPDRDDRERALMIAAAQAARKYWERAGTWLETERAEYRLARTWLCAGDPARALDHARACVELVQAQPEPPALERFFGWEAVALAEGALGHAEARAAAVAEVEAAFADLSEQQRGWCITSLDALTG